MESNGWRCDFAAAMEKVLGSELVETDNGAAAYRTHGGEHAALLDLNFSVTQMRTMDEAGIAKKFAAAMLEDPLLAMRWLAYAMDIRHGLGERKISKAILHLLVRTVALDGKALACLIPEFNRWDMVFELLNTALEPYAIAAISDQLAEDCSNVKRRLEGEKNLPISLLGKWMPSENCHSFKRSELARTLAKKLGMDMKTYRRMLSALRSELDVVERKMSDGKWSQIDYSSVPSKANINYAKAFAAHDPERRKTFLANVKAGRENMNASVLSPCEIAHRVIAGAISPEDADALWQNLPDCVGEGDGGTLCVVDTSGSMYWREGNGVRPIDAAVGMGFYFAERLKGAFKDTFITFAANPRIHSTAEPATLSRGERMIHVSMLDICESTNLKKVFDLVLETAVSNRMEQSDLPSRILVISDMQFDGPKHGLGRPDAPSLLDAIAARYEEHGYKLPKLVFWNVEGVRRDVPTIPCQKNDMGLVTVSGYSPSIARMVMTGKMNPFEALKDVLMSPRYDRFERVLTAARRFSDGQ